MKYIIRFSTLSIFWSDWIRSVKMNQNGSNWIKMDQTWSYQISDEIINEIYRQIFNFISCLIRFNQICPKWIKLDQNVSSDFQIYLFFDQNGSDLSKMDQTWSNWISDETIIEICHQIFNFIYILIRFYFFNILQIPNQSILAYGGKGHNGLLK